MVKNAVVRSRISVDVLKPNKLTQETMRKTAQGVEVHEAKDAADLFDKLEI